MTWDVRTNIKAKPGSQGTLFQGGSDQMTDAKWPRGYTPERLHEVMGPITHGGQPWLVQGERGVGHHTGPARRDLIDTVARSTIPAGHLQGLQFFPGQLSLDHGGSEDTAGYYRHQGHRLGASVAHKPQVSIVKGQETGYVPIHEIGHHISREAGTHHSAYDTPYNKGKEEGFADDYAQTHYRPPRGDQYYGGVGTYADGLPGSGRTGEFYNAYHAQRGTPRAGVELRARADAETAHERANPTLPGLENRPWER